MLQWVAYILMLSVFWPHSSAAREHPETSLVSLVDAVRAARLPAALAASSELVRQQPNFHLARLIHADLLSAAAAPLTGFGNPAAQKYPSAIANLRAEAIARLAALNSPPPAQQLPAYLLQLAPVVRHVIVVDSSAARLYLWQHQAGQISMVASFYASIGKRGSVKWREGDKRTPTGIYRITSKLPRARLTDFYGSLALTLNYPNPLDHSQGRSGSGIWIHGTPKDSYSRPPLASDGCVVLANPDLSSLEQLIDWRTTPVIISAALQWRSESQLADYRAPLIKAMEQWVTQPSAGNSSESNEPPRPGQNTLTQLNLLRYPDDNNLVEVTFEMNSGGQRPHRYHQYWQQDANGTWVKLLEAAPSRLPL